MSDRAHGVAIAVSVVIYGFAVSATRPTTMLRLTMRFLACSGVADMMSAAYRSSLLQSGRTRPYR